MLFADPTRIFIVRQLRRQFSKYPSSSFLLKWFRYNPWSCLPKVSLVQMWSFFNPQGEVHPKICNNSVYFIWSRQFLTIVENKNLRGTHKGFCLEREILLGIFFYKSLANERDLPRTLDLAKACSLISARSRLSCKSTWAFLNLAKFKAAISSASSICLLYVRTWNTIRYSRMKMEWRWIENEMKMDWR